MSYFQCCLENRINDAIALIDCPKKLNSALRICSFNGNYDAVQKLLELGANPNAKCMQTGIIFINCTEGPNLSYTNRKPAVELAAMNNHGEIVKLMLSSQNINSSGILFYFMYHRNMDIIKYLFENGLSINNISDGDHNENPIVKAIRVHEEWPELIKYFIDQGLDITNDKVSRYFAQCYKNESLVKLLIENAFDVNNFYPYEHMNDEILKYFIDLIPYGMNFSNNEWSWILSMACKSGNTNIVQTLLDQGVWSKTGLPFKYAAEKGHVDCLKLLIEKNPQYLENNKELVITILSEASSGAHMCIIEYLDNCNFFYPCETLLFEAAKNGHLDLVKFYISKGINPRAETDYAMRIALLNNHIHIGTFLIELGCDPSAQNNFSMWWACLRENNDVIHLLERFDISSSDFTKKLIK